MPIWHGAFVLVLAFAAASVFRGQALVGGTLLAPGGDSQAPPKIAVMSACLLPKYGGRYQEASLRNKLAWCGRWGATCLLHTARHSTGTTHHARWEKFVRINEVLNTRPDIEWLFWLDCDAVFTNLTIDWRQQLGKSLNRDAVMIAGETKPDPYGLNTGVFLMPNTNATRQFVANVLGRADGIDQRKTSWKDQQALLDMKEEGYPLYSRIKRVPNRLMNSMYGKDKEFPAENCWQHGDWVAHQVDCWTASCVEHIVRLAEEGRLSLAREGNTTEKER